jgi:hypothetical protein
MAPDDFWTRKRKEEQKEKEEAEERAEEEARKLKDNRHGPQPKTESVGTGVPFEELVRRVPTLIDQLEHLYRQFAVGVLARPPHEERLRLDQMMTLLKYSAKATTTDRFKFNGMVQSYTTHRARWDKLLADVESGKIKRVAGPKKGPQRL